MYPSSIAVYGLPSLDEKKRVGRVSEDEWTHPTTMYGCNKLYCEQLGHYYARFYKQLAAESASGRVDFRCVRFPGLISAVTDAVGRHVGLRARDDSRCGEGRAVRVPSSGPTRAFRSWRCPTGSTRCCNWRPRRAGRLTRTAYNVAAFSPTAEEVRRVVVRAFPDADVTWQIDAKRQGIVDTWPADVDDSAARRDWGFDPRYDLESAFERLPDSGLTRRRVVRSVYASKRPDALVGR